MNRGIFSAIVCISAALPIAGWAQEKASFKFSLGTDNGPIGFVKVPASAAYTKELGYGFETRPGTMQDLEGGGVTSDQPFSFSVNVSEGNYRVTVTLGDSKKESTTTVKAETRRLMLEQIHTAAGKPETRTFVVNVRRPEIGNTGQRVEFDLREWPTYWTWDDKLTITFLGDHPAVSSLQIDKADDVTTVYLMSDSTVTDQMQGGYGTWGMNLPRWFNDKVAIANLAESGETVKGFRHEKRWDKILSMAKKGDYIFMQFGHNDINRPSGTDAMWPPDSWSGQEANKVSQPDTDYKEGLKQFITEAKATGAIPVVVTPMTKMQTTGRGGPATPSLGLAEYVKNAILAAKEGGAVCIDLNGMSIEMHAGLGPVNSGRAVMDGNHSNTYGGYVLSRCVVEGIKQNLPDLAKNLVADAGTFDLKHPEPLPDEFKLPNDPGQPGIPSFGGGRGRARGAASGPSTRAN